MTDQTLITFLRDDAGSPLGVGVPSGRPSRLDGERHYDAWLRLVRHDPCAYCGIPCAGTVDHVEPRSHPARGMGGTHSWLNVIGACQRCNGAKASRPLLHFLLARRCAQIQPRRRASAQSSGSSIIRGGGHWLMR